MAEEQKGDALPTEEESANPFDHWVRALDLWTSVRQPPDAVFYQDIVKQFGRPAVELGIGSGRVASAVRPDYGIDSSVNSLQRCGEVLGDDSQTQLILSDFATYKLNEPARICYAPLNTFNHLTDSAVRKQAFANIRLNTCRDGRLVFDAFMTSLERLRARNKLVVEQARGADWVLYVGATIAEEAESVLMEQRGVLEEEISPEGTSRRTHLPPLPLAYIPPWVFAIELENTGWHIEAAWGSFDRQPLTLSSGVQIWVARRD
jgi:hypothetical protein